MSSGVQRQRRDRTNLAAIANPPRENRAGIVARVWLGWTAARDAPAYVRYLDETHVREIVEAHGNRGVILLSRLQRERAELVLLSLWDSVGAIRRFVGDDIAHVVMAAPERGLLLEQPEVRDYALSARGDVALGAALLSTL